MSGTSAGLRALLLVTAVALGGCAAGYTAVAKRNLDVQTKMTDSVFLDPVPPAERTVYVEIRNTSDKPDLDLQQAIAGSLAARGYRVVEDPSAAHFWLQANVLQAGRNSETAIESAKEYLVAALRAAPAIGHGAGPLNHRVPSAECRVPSAD